MSYFKPLLMSLASKQWLRLIELTTTITLAMINSDLTIESILNRCDTDANAREGMDMSTSHTDVGMAQEAAPQRKTFKQHKQRVLD